MAGFTVNEGGTYPCMVWGNDIGVLLSILFVSGWLMLLTLPLGLVAIGIWLVVLIIHLVSRRLKGTT